MADLLLELFSEEIPARMQAQAAKDLERLVIAALAERGLKAEGSKAFAGPRRLTLAVAGLPVKQPDVREERKGPRVSAPPKAVEGFLRSAGVTLEQCQKQSDGKGEFYVAVIERQGRATAEVLSGVLPECFAKLPWPKSMRFPGSEVRWVRPLHGILCTFDGAVVPFVFAGVKSGNTTKGHRFLSSGFITAKNFAEYQQKLAAAHVVLDAVERKSIILTGARSKASGLGLDLIEDAGLLEEVAGLNEWPVVLIGKIEDQFMDVPAEVLQTSMRVHQKYFSLRDPKTGKMANRFAVVSNMAAEDGGTAITAGNERVLRARLSDAKFFWDQDRQHRLDSRVEKLKGITFHAKLGTQYERVERIQALAAEIAEKIGADVEKAKRAALLCKADLTTGMVGEFPELQGVMGRYYALHDGEDPEVADAIRDHYRPAGPSDVVPTAKVSIAVALADKLDQLVGFFSAGEKPTGSGDPYALRRAALGVTRILLLNSIRLSLYEIIRVRAEAFGLSDLAKRMQKSLPPIIAEKLQPGFKEIKIVEDTKIRDESVRRFGIQRAAELLSFLADRLQVALREKGTRYDLINAVFSLGDEDDLVRLVARVEALQTFLASDDGANLLVAFRRAANILAAEEKKQGGMEFGTLPTIYQNVPQEELTLSVALQAAQVQVRELIPAEKFVEAMAVMAKLRAPVDAFFEKVRVNDDDPVVRRARLELLSRLRETLRTVADFSKIEG